MLSVNTENMSLYHITFFDYNTKQLGNLYAVFTKVNKKFIKILLQS